MSNIQTKFRPSLTLDEINTIISALQSTGESKLVRKLHTFTFKAQIGITSPSHVTVPKQSLEDSLGFGTSQSSSSTNQGQTGEQLYEIWKTSPSSLSSSQLDKVHHYRYTNDLMTPEEESNYENGM